MSLFYYEIIGKFTKWIHEQGIPSDTVEIYVHHAVPSFSANNRSIITIGIADNYNALGMKWIAEIAAKIYHFDCTSLPSEI